MLEVCFWIEKLVAKHPVSAVAASHVHPLRSLVSPHAGGVARGQCLQYLLRLVMYWWASKDTGHKPNLHSVRNLLSQAKLLLMMLGFEQPCDMQGHTAAVTHVAINERSSQVISLAADKIIKV